MKRNNKFDAEEDHFSEEEKYTKRAIDLEFNIKKPADHAKAGEWRKWKMMKREIKQVRTEKKLVRQQKAVEESIKNEKVLQFLKTEKRQGRKYTLSIAIPSSIIEKVQSKELKTYVCGQLARAACLFNVDEIVVFDENPVEANNKFVEDDNQLMVRVLEYLECPQYLRKTFFPSQKLLEFVGLLNPLDAPHHQRVSEIWDYREGVTTDLKCSQEAGCWVDIGLMNKILVDKKIKPGVRVTVKKQNTTAGKYKGLVVSPSTPRTQDGLYWGYQVRFASSFKKVFQECPHDLGYDLKIGSSKNSLNFDNVDKFDRFEHCIIVFGGSHDIEATIEADEKLKCNSAEELFDYVISKQGDLGSRSVRSEEAILVTLASIRPRLEQTWAEITQNEIAQDGSEDDKNANSSEHQSDNSDEDE